MSGIHQIHSELKKNLKTKILELEVGKFRTSTWPFVLEIDQHLSAFCKQQNKQSIFSHNPQDFYCIGQFSVWNLELLDYKIIRYMK